ncbi:MAG: type VI secretion system lipoprotein TssJ [Lysobacteraceae bacterium]
MIRFRPLRSTAFLVCLSALLAISACGKPKPVPPTIVNITSIASVDTNPDSNDRASPVAVRIYSLRSLAAFESADFYSLFEKDTATLGMDLAGKEEFILSPGQSSPLEKTLADDVRFIGVVAAFRDIERASWRASIPVPAAQTTPVTVSIGARSVTVTSP